MLIAFFGCFRLSNLVPVSKKVFDPLKQLKVNDVKFKGDLVLIYYKYSKTNQNARKVTWVPIQSVSDPRFSVVKNLKLLFKRVKSEGDSPLFSFSGSKFHTRHSLVRVLDKCIYSTSQTIPLSALYALDPLRNRVR